MVMLHAGPPPSNPLALLALLALAASIFVTAAIISDLQRRPNRPPRSESRGAVRREGRRGRIAN
jgi:hypothetical protein